MLGIVKSNGVNPSYFLNEKRNFIRATVSVDSMPSFSSSAEASYNDTIVSIKTCEYLWNVLNQTNTGAGIPNGNYVSYFQFKKPFTMTEVDYIGRNRANSYYPAWLLYIAIWDGSDWVDLISRQPATGGGSVHIDIPEPAESEIYRFTFGGREVDRYTSCGISYFNCKGYYYDWDYIGTSGGTKVDYIQHVKFLKDYKKGQYYGT